MHRVPHTHVLTSRAETMCVIDPVLVLCLGVCVTLSGKHCLSPQPETPVFDRADSQDDEVHSCSHDWQHTSKDRFSSDAQVVVDVVSLCWCGEKHACKIPQSAISPEVTRVFPSNIRIDLICSCCCWCREWRERVQYQRI